MKGRIVCKIRLESRVGTSSCRLIGYFKELGFWLRVNREALKRFKKSCNKIRVAFWKDAAWEIGLRETIVARRFEVTQASRMVGWRGEEDKEKWNDSRDI